MDNTELNKIKSPKKLIPKGGNDCVMTPPDLARQIVGHFNPSGCILEPCMGDGSFYYSLQPFALNEQVDWCELSKGRDFLTTDFGGKKYTYIVTNPPFSKFRAFLKKSMEVADNIIFLCTINHVFGLRARLKDIKDAGFYIRETLLCNTPKSWPQSGFQVGAIYLSKREGACKFSYLD
jgi:hypothetical protein